MAKKKVKIEKIKPVVQVGKFYKNTHDEIVEILLQDGNVSTSGYPFVGVLKDSRWHLMRFNVDGLNGDDDYPDLEVEHIEPLVFKFDLSVQHNSSQLNLLSQIPPKVATSMVGKSWCIVATEILAAT